MNEPRITVLGVGNILFRDEGVGVRVVERLQERYRFPGDVDIVDGGVLGMNLMGLIASTDFLIIVDAIRNGETAGTLYRMEGEEIPHRILSKNSLHQVDLPEVLTLCRAIDKEPQVVVVGVEPADMASMNISLTPVVAQKVDALVAMVLDELKMYGIKGEVKDC